MTKLPLLAALLVLGACAPVDPGPASDAASLDAAARDAGPDDGDDARDAAAGIGLVEGLYFHSFTGSVEGTELATWGVTEGSFVFSDLTAAGAYAASFAPDGSFVFERGVGSGAFVDDSTAAIDFAFGGGLHFHSEIRRAPYTDARFPVYFTTAVAGDPSLAGAWDAEIRDVDPATGDTLGEAHEEVSIEVSGTTVRLTLPGETYYRATWIAADQAALRVITPTPSRAAYRTFPGCATSSPLDVLGDLRVRPDGAIEMTLCFQTHDALGAQQQTMQHLTMTRAPADG